MSDYINRKELKQLFMYTEDGEYSTWTLSGVISEIDDCPSADVRENIYGEWIPYPGGYVCSNCRKKDRKTAIINMKAYQYCPDCGCKIRVRKETNDKSRSNSNSWWVQI